MKRDLILYIRKGSFPFLAGIVNGLFGGGGGMILVPLLQKLGFETKSAHVIALLTVLPICILSSAIYLFSTRVELSVFLPVAIGSVIGGLIGTRLLLVLPEKWVTILFSLLMIFVGGRMLF